MRTSLALRSPTRRSLVARTKTLLTTLGSLIALTGCGTWKPHAAASLANDVVIIQGQVRVTLADGDRVVLERFSATHDSIRGVRIGTWLRDSNDFQPDRHSSPFAVEASSVARIETRTYDGTATGVAYAFGTVAILFGLLALGIALAGGTGPGWY